MNLAALITSLWMLPTLDGSARYLFFIPFVLTKVITIIFFLFVSRMTWFAFFLFTVLHVFANLRAVKAVTMETLNRARFLIILKQYASTKTVSSIKDVNKLEPVVMGLIPTGNLRSVTRLLDYLILQIYCLEKDVCGYRIELGSSIKLLASENIGFESQLANYSGRNFALVPHPVTKTIYVIFRRDCKAEEMLEAYSQAVLSAMLASGQTVSRMVCSEDKNYTIVVRFLFRSWD